MDCLAVELFLDSCFSNTVFGTLLRTAVETAINGIHKLVRTSLTLLFWQLADGLFGLSRSELWDELLTGVLSICVRSSPAVLYSDTAVVFRGEPQKPDNSARATINAS